METIASRFDEFLGCWLIGDPRDVFGYFSTDYFERLRALDSWNFGGKDGESVTMAVFFASTGERIELDVVSLQHLPDGHIDGSAHGQTDFYIWFVLENGQYQIDEFHRISADPIEPEPSPSP